MGDVTREMDALAFEGDDLREALRKEHARVAELEREQEKDRAALAQAFTLGVAREMSLAEREAEVAELREALAKVPWPCDCRGPNEGCFHRTAYALLARAPGSSAALRAMLTKAVKKSWDGALEYATGGQFDSLTDVEAEGIVSRLLGEPEEGAKG